MQSQPTDSSDFANPNFTRSTDAAGASGAPSHPAHGTEMLLHEPMIFSSRFIDSMEMNADARTVARYLDVHQEWFHRCAHPMHVEPIGRNSYALIIGHFGAFGYDVEPKIGLDLLPQQEGIYRIETVPVPNEAPLGYEVDFQAAMNLIEHPSQSNPTLRMTQIQWQLDLQVAIQFPRFIHALPDSLVRNTGDRILRQVVRQVSRRLTHKVQEDFHASRNLSMPKRTRRKRL
ncbi:DUF1997 domain-containing protein [Cyanobacteria bacterium FACHB-DQ100]|uniref:DUF1997 domain-containing protein n=1 Tax=Leptolyngbya sp. DQ-M1 TaxID=2933920 RepID=UPI0019B710AA|nr:DUF1997 domain-containing protein [Cyanobacteria bacterium FACHB-DQ100]